MILLQVNDLAKSFGADVILSNIKLEVKSGDRVAIVGRNGAGKSTLLKIIASKLSYDSGEIIKPKEVSIGYLEQNSGLSSSLTIWDEMELIFSYLKETEQQMRDLEMQMAEVDPSSQQFQSILKKYDQLQHEFSDQGGYQYEADIRSVLHGLGFGSFDYETSISTLSGGQKTRLALAKLLLIKPDLLILDEPTNHLDIETLTWLEQYLQTYHGALLIVSHDRYFLDKVVNLVYELSRTRSKKYHGNYSDYLDQKAADYEKDLKLYEKQQDEVASLKEFIQKNLARASTTKRAQSRRKQLEKMELLDRPQGDEKSAHFSFTIDRPSGNDVLKGEKLAFAYEDLPIFENVSFHVSRGDSIALVGPNGVGKSTLLKTIIKKLSLQTGELEYGKNVSIGYYDQEQANLTSNKRVLNELWDEFPLTSEKDVRTILGNFLFTGDDVLKSVSTLSGGEKARLALSKLMMQKANFLILDEPTNHLDLDSKEVLENALIDYPGTILFVSHDRYFINRIGSKVFELSQNSLTEYLGDYDYFLTKKAEQMELKELENNKAKINTTDKDKSNRSFEEEKELKKQARQRKRRIEEIEQTMEKIEQNINSIETKLHDPNNAQDHELLQQLTEENNDLNSQLLNLLEEWETLVEE
ncbi:ABC-F family ATP-binding cassette domain-containing protein [Bacillus carboniphilus]|uniref:ABC-F family ATP-binding cassette domain-containing protein n=1 Tax=Bacillus carboniphilus TaxID=86663 RepID=A0ABY9JTT1_9BACI|nr:ABC-F family ATP-binding cassette domain-containing protein [Bacillus carboniphilus]WLR42158.1 ABC-F family ATP-binding cassette domain-containing protein [Bacillus carboniphilus]